jgi:hypothetical protein
MENVTDFGGGGSRVSVYTRILGVLRGRFENDLANNRPHLIGLIIGDPSEPLVKEQIIPKLEFWHHRSANYIDLFCVGFSAVAKFDAKEFNSTLRTLESNTDWRYSGGTDLILINVTYSAGTKEVTLDFTSALAMTLEAVVKVDGFERLSIFFEKVMNAARESCGVESPAEVSDAFGRSLLKSVFKGLLTSLLPDGMKKEARDAFLFAVKDISKKY